MKYLKVGTLLLGVAFAGAAFAGPPTYQFGARLNTYNYGIKANHKTPSDLDNDIKVLYDKWKNPTLPNQRGAALVNVPTLTGGKAVKFNANYLTVSEAMGYGMLISVLMAGYDSQAQTNFDGLLKTVRARPAYSMVGNGGQYLMDWRLAADGSSTSAAGGGYNAVDGDLDIAMALLMADRQWGSTGTWNYKQQAINTINAIKAWNMRSDGTTMGLPTAGVSRTSDYMIGHFRAFKAATNDGIWDLAISRAYSLTNRMQTVYSPTAGFMPDFIVGTDTTSPYPSPGGMGDGTNTEGYYFANAQRNPWRWGTDFVYSGDPQWKSVLSKMMTFIYQDSKSPSGVHTPGEISGAWNAAYYVGMGYKMNGTKLTQADLGYQAPPIGIVAGFMNASQSDAAYQDYLNNCWEWLKVKATNDYYDSELTLLSMIVASGNWWNPSLPAPVAARIQAENGTLSGSGVSVRTDIAGYEGSAFVGSFTNTGDKLTTTFPNVATGVYDIQIRYHTWQVQQNNVVINGVSSSRNFPTTGSNWAIAKITGVTLPSGTNSVAVSMDWGYIDVDYIEIVPAAGTPVAIQVQAENGTLSGTGVSVRTDTAGYEGSGFVGEFTANGDTLTVPFPNVVAGNYNITIRYQAWSDEQNNVVVNGASRSITFPQTGSGWGLSTINAVALTNGTNSISVNKNWGYMNIDWIRISP